MKSLTVFGSLLLVLSSAAVACFEDVPVGSGGTDASDGGTRTGCTSDSECGSNETCGFLASDACQATGQCVATSGGVCESEVLGCACDGTEVAIGCDHYASKPVAHTGACKGDGGGTSPPADASTTCVTSADCTTGEVCGFAQADACTATGRCFVETGGAICNSYEAGCACDGTEINLVCNGLPDGVDTKPVAHAGACTDGGS